MLIYSRIKRKIRRNLKCFLSSIMLILVLNAVFTIKNEMHIPTDISQYLNDFNVNTSDYLSRFNDYRKVKLKQKNYSDTIQFSNTKTVINNARLDLRKPSYTIFEYTKFFGQTKYCQINQTENIFLNECPYKNCRFSCEPKDLTAADAILFHESDMKNDMKSDVNYIERISKMHLKNPDQIFILWNDEANEISDKIDSIKFNWSLSYRYDAEVSGKFYFSELRK